jgi:hypothetical protein
VVYGSKPQETKEKRAPSVGRFLAVVIIVGVAVFGYHAYRDEGRAPSGSDTTVMSHQEPSTSPPQQNSSPD